jgi:ferredoxin-like protein FixX
MISAFFGKPREGMTVPNLKFYPKQPDIKSDSKDEKIDFWMCSCCGNAFDGDQEQPVNIIGNELFECALCDVVNAERELMETN